MTESASADRVCSREAIHIPGAIQPYGTLLVVDEADGDIVAVSRNVTAMLGLPQSPEQLLGQPLADVLGAALVLDLAAQHADGGLAAMTGWETTVRLPSGCFELAAHVQAGNILIELAPYDADHEADALAAARRLQRDIHQLRLAEASLEDLAGAVVRGVRAITGYDRVLVYRFDADWHGQAIAESRAPDWPQSFLGLHFPASDIPAQARALYHRSTMRWMPMRDYEAVPLLQVPGLAPVDLSFTRLRSMSPIHRQYHRSMGVDGSMSFSVLDEGRLWGLVVCHHRTPHAVSPARRAAAAALVDAFALRLRPVERAEAAEARQRDAETEGHLLVQMAHAGNLHEALVSGPHGIGDLFGCSGAAVVVGGTITLVGRTPGEECLGELAAWLRQRQAPGPAFLTDRLPDICPAMADQAATASGLLAVFLSPDRADMLLWFRPEHVREVAWSGNPHKTVEGTATHPTPRASFERWVELRRGQAQPWEAWEVEMALGLRHAITEVIVRHLRQLAELNERVRQLQKMEAIGQLTGGVAHDFNNLLTVILGSMRLLERAPVFHASADAPRANRLLQAALQAAERGAGLTHRLLAFARKQALEPVPLSPNTLIEGMAELLRRTLGHGIELQTGLAPDLWRVRADANGLENAVINLAVNARDAMPRGGKLTIETSNLDLDAGFVAALQETLPAGQYVRISVSDTGTGMDQDTLSRAFEPFFTTKEAGRGTGLGLAQVFGFIRQSGGQVRIYSEPGQGTTLHIYLPRLVGEEAAAMAPPDAASPLARGEAVLVVEDDVAVRAYSAEVLRELGYRVLEAGTGVEALTLLERNPRTAVLCTDVGLPGGMDGLELAEAAQARLPSLRVLFVSGYAPQALLRGGRVGQGAALIAKPFAPADLGRKLREVLEAPPVDLQRADA